MDNKEEKQYLDLITNIIENGYQETSRNGETISIFGHMMKFSLKDGLIPILTTKKVAIKTCFEELMWFIRGQTDNSILNKKNVHIWDGNSTRTFLDSTGLHHLEDNDIGASYGYQWRHYGAEYLGCKENYDGKGIDQLQNIINDLKDEKKRTSRRLVITSWNPTQLNDMALPPCHMIMQFNVREGKYLSCALYQRSADVGLGVPFNIASYAFLTHILAKHCNLIAEEFIYFMGNCHIYMEHLEILKEQIVREPLPFPSIYIKERKENINDYEFTDIEWKEEYKSFGKMKMKMK